MYRDILDPKKMDEDEEWEAAKEMEEELFGRRVDELQAQEPRHPREVLFDAVRTFIDASESKIEKRLVSVYQKKIDTLQAEIAIHLSDKHSLADTITAMESHIKYLENRLHSTMRALRKE